MASSGGRLLVPALRRARGDHLGGRTFPSANLDATDPRRTLTPFVPDLQIETRRPPTQARHGYGGILLTRGRRPAA
ncbi:MAG: hypothetical protein ABTQ27_13470 [Amaricoccus sp.]|uniref:hypothetical protein n=1 Tax=Amaricoccus sp. TaxID=1872485 RepID=UPI0033150B83